MSVVFIAPTPQSTQVLGACKATGELCNLLAMTYLQREEYGVVSELLKKAEILTEHDPPGRAVTYNNFACYSRQQGRLHAALSFLQKALRIEERLAKVDNPADTHLNLCAVLSQLSRHREALEHAQAALLLLQEELFGSGASVVAAQKPDRIAVLAICYHNIGVECEFMKHFGASVQAYNKGVEVATVYLGAGHGIALTLKRSLEAARASMEKEAAKAGAGGGAGGGGGGGGGGGSGGGGEGDPATACSRALRTGVASDGMARRAAASAPTTAARTRSPRPAGHAAAPPAAPAGAAAAPGASPYTTPQALKPAPHAGRAGGGAASAHASAAPRAASGTAAAARGRGVSPRPRPAAASAAP